MAKFIYRMQSILSIKEKMEEQAKMEFAAASIRLREEEERLRRMIERREEYLAEGARMRSAVLDPPSLQENEAAVRYMKEAIKEQRKQVKKAEEALEKARATLQEYMLERKTHEQLKEAAFEQFKIDLAKEESKEVDELVSYVYGRKRVVE